MGEVSLPVTNLGSGTESVPHTDRNHILVDDYWTMKEAIATLERAQRIAFDMEATDLSPFTAIPLLLQVAVEEDGKTVAFVVVLPAFEPGDGQLAYFLKLLTNGRRLVIGHNLDYDYRLLKHHYGVGPQRVYDTMLAEMLLTQGEYDEKHKWLSNLSLAHLHYAYLGTELSKEERKSFLTVVPDSTWRPTAEQANYAAQDVLCLHEITRLQCRKLRQEDLFDAARLRFAALPPICDVELRGMLIDQRAWRIWLAEQQQRKQDAEVKLQALLTPYEWAYQKADYEQKQAEFDLWEQALEGRLREVRAQWEAAGLEVPPWGEYKVEQLRVWRETYPRPEKPKAPGPDFVINLRSTPQMRRAFEAMGFTDLQSTDAETRAKLLKRTDLTPEQREMLETYGEFTGAAHNLSSFGENILALVRPTTGRLHSNFNIGITETGRMSSERPNFQNFPHDARLRSAFVADPGCVVITADFKSQELAIVAALSGDRKMQGDLAAGRDLYKELASRVYGVPVTGVSSDQRRMCKSALLGINYGLTEVGLERNNQIPREEGRRIIAEIKALYPDMVKWSDHQVDQAMTERYVRTAAGAKRYFRDRMMPTWKIATEARNAPVQGTAADICYRVVDRLSKALPEGSYLANIVHDEMVVVCPEDEAERVELVVIREMQDGFNDVLPELEYGVRCGVDTHVAAHWKKD